MDSIKDGVSGYAKNATGFDPSKLIDKVTGSENKNESNSNIT